MRWAGRRPAIARSCRGTSIEREFRLEDVNSSPAFFDVKKLARVQRRVHPRDVRRRVHRRVCSRGSLAPHVPWPTEQFDADVFAADGAARADAGQHVGRGTPSMSTSSSSTNRRSTTAAWAQDDRTSAALRRCSTGSSRLRRVAGLDGPTSEGDARGDRRGHRDEAWQGSERRFGSPSPAARSGRRCSNRSSCSVDESHHDGRRLSESIRCGTPPHSYVRLLRRRRRPAAASDRWRRCARAVVVIGALYYGVTLLQVWRTGESDQARPGRRDRRARRRAVRRAPSPVLASRLDHAVRAVATRAGAARRRHRRQATGRPLHRGRQRRPTTSSITVCRRSRSCRRRRPHVVGFTRRCRRASCVSAAFAGCFWCRTRSTRCASAAIADELGLVAYVSPDTYQPDPGHGRLPAHAEGGGRCRASGASSACIACCRSDWLTWSPCCLTGVRLARLANCPRGHPPFGGGVIGNTAGSGPVFQGFESSPQLSDGRPACRPSRLPSVPVEHLRPPW